MQVNNVGIPGAIIDGDALADSGNDMVSSVSMIFFLCQKRTVIVLGCNFEEELLDCNFRIRHYHVI